MMVFKELEFSMKYCENCGKKLNHSNDDLCPDCRRKVGRRPGSSMRKLSVADTPIGLTKQEFLTYYSKGARLCGTAAILGYLSAIAMLAIVVYFYRDSSAIVFVDVSFLLLLGLLLHITKKRAVAFLYLAFCVLNAVIYLVTEGRFIAALPIISAILGVIGAFWYDREWRAYHEQYGFDSD